MTDARATVGPHCDHHRQHRVGCLDCAYEVAWASGGFDHYIEALTDLGWNTMELGGGEPTVTERTD